MLTKLCSSCQREQATTEFGIRRRALDGLQVWCRDCMREYQRVFARNHRDPKKHREAAARYRMRNRHKVLAQSKVKAAMKSGRIAVPLWCQQCHCVTQLEAHHSDYSKPLDVLWLCTTCHGLAHRSNRGGKVKHA